MDQLGWPQIRSQRCSICSLVYVVVSIITTTTSPPPVPVQQPFSSQLGTHETGTGSSSAHDDKLLMLTKTELHLNQTGTRRGMLILAFVHGKN
jgi:hypothetical protein